MPERIYEEVIVTATWAEEIRESLGGLPMKVLSWYRCAAWNRRVGGATNSQHLLGRAIDFVQKTRTPADTQDECAKLFRQIITGLGIYPGFTHIDRRIGKSATWGEKHIEHDRN